MGGASGVAVTVALGVDEALPLLIVLVEEVSEVVLVHDDSLSDSVLVKAEVEAVAVFVMVVVASSPPGLYRSGQSTISGRQGSIAQQPA